MERLRIISVLEHEVIPVIENGDVTDLWAGSDPWFTQEEAQALLLVNEVRRGFCQRLSGGVRFAQHCGIVRLPNCVVEVLPKIGLDDARMSHELDRSRGALLAMLRSAGQITITNVGPVPQKAVRAPLLDIFIEAFLHSALEQARRGLLSRYMTNVDDLPVVKGKFQAHGHVRRNLARPHLLHCEYDEFTTDNGYNRAIRATLEVCRTWVERAATQRLWFETHSRYAGITSVRISGSDVARLPRNRTTRRYETVLKWCEWLLSLASPALSAGAQQAPGLLFDMNKLFEAHAARLEELASGSERIVSTQGPPLHLANRGSDDVFLLKPDITVWHIGQDGSPSTIDRVVDAKWKRLEPQASDFGVDQADIYQLLAYAWRYGCTTLELAYPMPDALDEHILEPVFDINDGFGDSVRVRLKLIPLWSRAFDPNFLGWP